MRAFLIAAGAALTLTACGSGDSATNDANMIEMDNMSADQNAVLNDIGGMDGNAMTNAATENMMINDMTSNDADTNLANGM